MSANHNTSNTEALPFDQRKPLHKAFQWADPSVCDRIPAHSAISFFNLTRDITAGAVTVLQMLERDQLAADSDDEARPLLSPVDTSNLMRMTIAALSALNETAEGRTSWAGKYGPKWAARERAQKGGAT